MIKEIGSIFPINPNQDFGCPELKDMHLPDNMFLYSLCREALFDIARSNLVTACNTVLIPAYTCSTVYQPFRRAGYKTIFYAVDIRLRLDTEALQSLIDKYKPKIIVVHPYYGMGLNDNEKIFLSRLQSRDIKIIVDLTQCIYDIKNYDFADFLVGSYRKWFPLADGAFLKYKHHENISRPTKGFTPFVNLCLDARKLRDEYFKTGKIELKEESIRLDKESVLIANDEYDSHVMSDVSVKLLKQQRIKEAKERRMENYFVLFSHITDTCKIHKVCKDIKDLRSAPLYFPIYVEKRSELQKLLAQNRIYAPVLWPVEDDSVLINDEVRYIYSHILCIPIDQRYDSKDMHRIAQLINLF